MTNVTYSDIIVLVHWYNTSKGETAMKVLRKIGNFFVAMVPFWVYYAVQIFASIVLLIVLAVKSIAAGETFDITNANSLMIISVVSQITAFIGGILTMLISRTKMSDMSPVKQSGKVYGLTVLFTIGSFFVLQLINSLSLSLMGVTETDSTQDLLAQSVPFMFFTALFAPFVEELIFRGLLVTFFKKRGFSNWFTIAAITLVFGLIHSQNMMIYALCFGLVLMGIRFVTGDWKLCVVFHFIGNLMSCLFNILVTNEETGMTVLIVGSIVGGIIAVITAVIGIKTAKERNHKDTPVLETAEMC